MYGKLYRGFESLSLRHPSLACEWSNPSSASYGWQANSSKNYCILASRCYSSLIRTAIHLAGHHKPARRASTGPLGSCPSGRPTPLSWASGAARCRWVCGFRWPVQPRRRPERPPRCGTPNRRDRQNLRTRTPRGPARTARPSDAVCGFPQASRVGPSGTRYATGMAWPPCGRCTSRGRPAGVLSGRARSLRDVPRLGGRSARRRRTAPVRRAGRLRARRSGEPRRSLGGGRKKYREFLRRGWLAGSFARFRCHDCGLDRLAPFSRKARACCPCCGPSARLGPSWSSTVEGRWPAPARGADRRGRGNRAASCVTCTSRPRCPRHARGGRRPSSRPATSQRTPAYRLRSVPLTETPRRRLAGGVAARRPSRFLLDFLVVPSTKTAIVSPVPERGATSHDERPRLKAGVPLTRERQTSGHR